MHAAHRPSEEGQQPGWRYLQQADAPASSSHVALARALVGHQPLRRGSRLSRRCSASSSRCTARSRRRPRAAHRRPQAPNHHAATMAGASGRSLRGAVRDSSYVWERHDPGDVPFPRAVAWIELLGVARSSESRWLPGMRAAREHPTTDLPNSATNAVSVTSQGGDQTAVGCSEASGPWEEGPRGRTRTGLEVEITTRSTGRYRQQAESTANLTCPDPAEPEKTEDGQSSPKRWLTTRSTSRLVVSCRSSDP